MESLMPAQRKYPPELIDRAVRMVVDKQRETPGRQGIVRGVGDMRGIHPEALRHWVKKAEVDAGHRPGVTISDVPSASGSWRRRMSPKPPR